MANSAQPNGEGGFSKVYTDPNPAQKSMRMTYTSFPLPAKVKEVVDGSQLVRVTSRSVENKEMIDIECVLQEDVNTDVRSTWAPFMPTGKGFVQNTANDFQQAMARNATTKAIGYAASTALKSAGSIFEHANMALTGSSTVSGVSTRRMWTGTSPLSLHLNLRFDAYDDAETEVYLPIMKLMFLAIPYKGGGGSFGFLIPPGPSPYPSNLLGGAVNYAMSLGQQSNSPSGESTVIRIGGLLTLSKVLVTAVQPKWDRRCDHRGIPIGATVLLSVETFEAITRQDLMDAMMGNQMYGGL